jgi:hypothetical protein
MIYNSDKWRNRFFFFISLIRTFLRPLKRSGVGQGLPKSRRERGSTGLQKNYLLVNLFSARARRANMPGIPHPSSGLVGAIWYTA